MSTESQPGSGAGSGAGRPSDAETTAMSTDGGRHQADATQTMDTTDPSTTTPDGSNAATTTMTRPDRDTTPGQPAAASSSGERTSSGDRSVGRSRTWPTPPWIGTRTGDIGLLVLRLTLAVSFVGHGLQKFGLFGGPGIEAFSQSLGSQYGYRFPLILSYVNALTEVVGGVLVAVGLLTPLAAAGLLGVMINSTLLKLGSGFFYQTGGFEVDVVLGGLAAGIVLLGAGRIALDAKVPGMLRLQSLRWVFLVIGIAAALAVYLLLRTGSPISL